MATSGTVGTTVIDTATLLEHAVRRAGLTASHQTPEMTKAARESLFMLLLGLSNNGYNLWCLETFYQGLVPGQERYAMPPGTLNLTNVVFSQPTLADTAQSATATSTSVTFSSSTVARVGVLFTAVTESDTLTVEGSTDGATWATLASQVGGLTTGAAVWLAASPVGEYSNVRVVTVSPHTATLYVATNIYDLPVTPWSQDTYQNINNKLQSGSPSTNYTLERKLDTYLTLWPVPNSVTDHLTLRRHRQVQDVGTLSEELEIPTRWYEGISWHAALRIAMETPGVDTARIQLCAQFAAQYTFEVGQDETDGAPTTIVPGIRVYTR